MLNFNYSIPTKIFFGKDQINGLVEQIRPYGSRVLLVYGGGSIKQNGIYQKVAKLLKANDFSFWELPGIDPNPRISSVRSGIELCRDNQVDLILAIGGGSALDAAKVIAAGFYYPSDPWDLMIGKGKVTQALPIGTILTLAATGSEMDPFAVISNLETRQKIGLGHPAMVPQFSILDPSYTFTVPAHQTAAGTADIMSHVLESYFSKTTSAFLQDRVAEAILKTCIKYGPIAMEKPEDYEARANLMWASSLAINGLLSYGKESRWSVHPMEHELSAFYDITHGVGLAILTPYWMDYVLNDHTVEKFKEYGVNIWGLDPEGDSFAVARQAITETRNFFRTLGLPSTLKEVGIDREHLEAMALAATAHGELGSFRPIGTHDVLQIFRAALGDESL